MPSVLNILDSKKMSGLAYFRVMAGQVREASEAGYSLKAIYTALNDIGEVPFTYAMFCRYCRSYSIRTQNMREQQGRAFERRHNPPAFRVDPD